MKIYIYSYREVQRLWDKGRNWISIRDIGYDELYKELDKEGKNILKLYFDDITEFNKEHNLLHPFYNKQAEKRELRGFTTDIAERIKRFTDEVYMRGQDIQIHCWAGISRSQAIGAELNIYYNLFLQNNEEDFIINLRRNNGRYCGNYDVSRIMKESLYHL